MVSATPLEILERHRSELREFGVKSLAVFGSQARAEAKPESDIDLLVEFDQPIGLLGFSRLRHRLEEILGRRVDLVTLRALKRQMRERILSEVSHANQRLEI